MQQVKTEKLYLLNQFSKKIKYVAIIAGIGLIVTGIGPQLIFFAGILALLSWQYSQIEKEITKTKNGSAIIIDATN